jgi:hypothetical protein
MPLRLVALITLGALASPHALRADAFDLYTNPILAKVPGATGVEEVKNLTFAQLTDAGGVLPGIPGTFLVVRTNGNRYGKLLVQAGRQKAREGKAVPMLLIDRFTTYKEGQERAVEAASKNVSLFPGFRFGLDLGQVVPEELGGDIRLVASGDKVHVEPLGKARLYLLTKPLAEAAPRKAERAVIGDKFDPKYFNGTYRLHDDGRRSGKLTLKVGEGGEVTGAYYSDKDGTRYDVRGRLGTQPYSVEFTVQFPRVEETFRGWLFSGDGQALTGSSRLGDREAGFYAVRVEGP